MCHPIVPPYLPLGTRPSLHPINPSVHSNTPSSLPCMGMKRHHIYADPGHKQWPLRLSFITEGSSTRTCVSLLGQPEMGQTGWLVLQKGPVGGDVVCHSRLNGTQRVSVSAQGAEGSLAQRGTRAGEVITRKGRPGLENCHLLTDHQSSGWHWGCCLAPPVPDSSQKALPVRVSLCFPAPARSTWREH